MAIGEDKTGSDKAPASVGATIQDAAGKVGAQASEMGGQVYRQTAEAGRYVGRQVEEQPMVAVMVAGAVGVLIGLLLGRSIFEERSLRDEAREYGRQYLPRGYRPR